MVCAAIIEYENNLDPATTPSNSVFDPDPSCVTLSQRSDANRLAVKNWSGQKYQQTIFLSAW